MHGGNNPFAASPLRLCLSTTYFDTETFLRVSGDLRIIYKKKDAAMYTKYHLPTTESVRGVEFGAAHRKESRFPEGFNLTKSFLQVSPNDKEMSGEKMEVSASFKEYQVFPWRCCCQTPWQFYGWLIDHDLENSDFLHRFISESDRSLQIDS